MGAYAGIDAGSVSVKAAVLNERGEIIFHEYRRHLGRPAKVAAELLGKLLERWPELTVAFTGAQARETAERLGAAHVSELAALAEGMRRCHPDVRSVIEMGGEDAKFLVLEDGALRDFSLNSVCAAGTGSFLDQQAARMRLSVEEFAALAAESENPPRIAGRCSVFAKSDMIHLQQIATPLRDIAGGLCFSVARNFLGAIVRNRPMPGRIAFAGGVALNRGVVRAFRELLGDQPGPDGLIVPEPPTVLTAAGAALRAEAEGTLTVPDLSRLSGSPSGPSSDPSSDPSSEMSVSASRAASVHQPLSERGDGFSLRHLCGEEDSGTVHLPEDGSSVRAWLGIDIGSISTNLAVTTDDGTLVAKRYLRTAGRPIEAVLTGLREIGGELFERFPDGEGGSRVRVAGVGTTGSGRYMIADFVGADVVRNEITAQATAAVFIDPSVDTIFEIGGQDSKYIRLKGGVICDFEMNKACAAGTGSFLEEQAEKLDVDVKGEFAELALQASAPCRLGERCTVFMENSLMDALQRGADRSDLLAGLSYSIVENYINRVVAGRSVGRNIFFQGGTAFNKAVVAAFERYTGREITVPPNHDVTGAIGMALIARDHMLEPAGGPEAAAAESGFRGFGLADRRYEQASFECRGCDNRCEINRVRIEGEKDWLFYGGRCEKYDIRRRVPNRTEDLFAFRSAKLFAEHRSREAAFAERGRSARRGKIGLPLVFFQHDYLPFYATLLWELGFQPVVSSAPPASSNGSPWKGTGQRLIDLGVKASLADTCFPVKAAMGHVRSLLDQGISRIFLPSFVNMAPDGDEYESGQACPLTQSFPYQVRAAFPEAEVVAPVIRLPDGRMGMLRETARAFSDLGDDTGWPELRFLGDFELGRALRKAARAQREFREALLKKGETVLSDVERRGERALVIIGRGYNAFDPGMNLDIPGKLSTLGVRAIPADFLPEPSIHGDWPDLYWRSGQRILRAARTVRENDRLHPLLIGNFSCGPDSFIHQFFQRELHGKPALHIEIDEHSADAGVITRCEAFLDSIAAREAASRQTEQVPAGGASPERDGGEAARSVRAGERKAFSRSGRRVVYIPRMCDHAECMRTALEACGVDAVVLPQTSPEAVALARKHVSGKECYPFAVTTADMLGKAAEEGFEPGRSAFWTFGGTGPCRFGQYNILQRMILDDLGLEDVPIFSPEQDVALYRELGLIGGDFTRITWRGVVSTDMLTRCLHESRPYEREPGSADELYAQALARTASEVAGPEDRFLRVLGEIRRDFENLPRLSGKKPRIGVVGEIFVRSNRFSNEELIRGIEALGGEAWLAPIDEWGYYVNWCSKRNALKRWWRIGDILRVVLTDRVQRGMGRRIEHAFGDLLATGHTPPTSEIIRRALPYLHHSFRGEAVLSVGAAAHMIEDGAAGIVNAMPFGCMPGTVASSLLRPLCDSHGVPTVTLAYDGSASPATAMQLEAFMAQVRGR